MNDFFESWRKTPALSLHQLTMLDASPRDLIETAQTLACTSVCIFTYVPEAARHIYPLVGPDNLSETRDALIAAGLTISNLEVFPLDGKTPLQDFVPSLKIGAALGAPRLTAHIHDADTAGAITRFAALCDLAAHHGLDVGLEFNAFSAVKTIAEAAAIIHAAGRANGRLVLDMLHLIRSGGSPKDVGANAPLIDFAQLCDGPAHIAEDGRWREAVGERYLPGTGDFPLKQILAALRPGTLIDVEVPQTAARKAGIPAPERARRAVAASRALLQGA